MQRSQEEPNLVLQKINEQLMTNYTVQMDDGHKITVKAWSASDAIQSALTKHLGHRVKTCHSGMGESAPTGVGRGGSISYDIPNHVPLTEKPKRPVKQDTTDPMFDAEEIRKESEYARSRMAYHGKPA